MAGFINSLLDAASSAIIGKATGAVNSKVSEKIDTMTEHARRLGKLKTFCKLLVGMTEAEATKKCQAQGLRIWAIRRDDRDFSFGGMKEKRQDRVMVEVDHQKVTKAYLG